MTERKLPNGDITVDDERNFRQTEYFYKNFLAYRQNFSPELECRALIIFAYDYLKVGLDEFADQLMEEVDKVCPDYMEKQLQKDMEMNKDFDEVCRTMVEFYRDKFKGAL